MKKIDNQQTRDNMLEGFTKGDLSKFAEECKERFLKLELDTMKEVLTGGICTYKKLLEEPASLNFRYEDEMDDYIEEPVPDIIECVIDDFKRDEENDKSLSAVKDWLEYLKIADKSMKGLYYVNDEDRICDEFGVPLSSDGKHCVFEIVRGGKFRWQAMETPSPNLNAINRGIEKS